VAALAEEALFRGYAFQVLVAVGRGRRGDGRQFGTVRGWRMRQPGVGRSALVNIFPGRA
jgi:hypothetical protein